MGDTTAAPAADEAVESTPSPLRQGLIVLGALLLGGVTLFGVYLYWGFERQHPVTNNAYVQANYVWISPRIDGQVSELNVVDNQRVTKGDVLFRLDPSFYQAELQAAQANLTLVQHEIAAGKAKVDAAQSAVTAQQAVVAIAQQRADRSKPLVRSNVIPELTGIELEQSLAEEEAKLASDKSDLVVAQQEYGTPETIQARLEKAQSLVALAKLNMEWTVVRAPSDGYVTNFTLRVGDVVETADSLFPFVETDEWWIQANFKETGVERIRVGQPVTITLDMYGDQEFKGTVESLGSSSAASFSLLPAQNTTGNWVKVTQRMPVRVALEPFNDAFPYRFGASATVEINTDAPTGDATAASR